MGHFGDIEVNDSLMAQGTSFVYSLHVQSSKSQKFVLESFLVTEKRRGYRYHIKKYTEVSTYRICRYQSRMHQLLHLLIVITTYNEGPSIDNMLIKTMEGKTLK